MSYGHQIINKEPQSHALAATALPLWLRLFAITAVLLLGCSSSTTAPGLNAPDQGSGKDGIKDDKIAGIVDNRDLRQTVTLQQITRKLHKQEFTTEILEQFKDTLDEGKLSPPVIDILLVIDNSGSMSVPQAKLSEKLEFLLEFIKQMNWQINVITTDNPCPTTPDLPLKSIPGNRTSMTSREIVSRLLLLLV